MLDNISSYLLSTTREKKSPPIRLPQLLSCSYLTISTPTFSTSTPSILVPPTSYFPQTFKYALMFQFLERLSVVTASFGPGGNLFRSLCLFPCFIFAFLFFIAGFLQFVFPFIFTCAVLLARTMYGGWPGMDWTTRSPLFSNLTSVGLFLFFLVFTAHVLGG